MADVGIAELLEAGVHFGHQTRRWNPKMRRFIHGERGGIYIIDLLKTQALLAQAQEFASTLAHRGGTVLFVGTKKQARDTVKEVAEAADMPYVNHRWLGGLLTNFQTISQRIRRLHDLERYEAEGQLALLPTRERMAAQADLAKLRANLGGVKNMQRVPDAMFVIDLKTEEIAVKEARRLRIPIIGLVDTNCDPDGIEFVVPGNDDAIRSCALITQAIGQVVSEGHSDLQGRGGTGPQGGRRKSQGRGRSPRQARGRRAGQARGRGTGQERGRGQSRRRTGRCGRRCCGTGRGVHPGATGAGRPGDARARPGVGDPDVREPGREPAGQAPVGAAGERRRERGRGTGPRDPGGAAGAGGAGARWPRTVSRRQRRAIHEHS